MTADLLPGSVLLNHDETDIIEQALFVAIRHGRPHARRRWEPSPHLRSLIGPFVVG
ncbi:hypothetical protein [Actinacidiphila yeochonensis]|uniref:hypothetical protein n=1 Tax=Actinacidiphila yeochonensis TaxID=89050 RepID=UPI000AA68150|nr:hypothetical protein [Actinacidiphila yeochonensis]